MKTITLLIAMSCTSCLCSKCDREAVEILQFEQAQRDYEIMSSTKHDDTNSATAYKNKRQYPNRGKRDNSDNTPISKLPKRGM